MNLTIKEIAELLQLTDITDERAISGVEFDSRQLTAGGLFVPLAGVRDGHDFIQAAIANGAAATLWSRPVSEAPAGIVVLPVPDVLSAFQKIAVYYLNKLAPKVVAITGSNGKTTTKDMTEAVLAQKFRTYKTQGNYNNNIGMPYTILHMPNDCEMLILEMGMDHAHEIDELSLMATPDAAAITIIGEAHIENLGSREKIAQAKMEIVDGLKPDGLLLVPADEELLRPLTENLSQTVESFGITEGDLQAVISSESRSETTFTVGGETFTIPVIGAYNVKNALIAYGFGRWFGLSVAEIEKGLAEFQLTKNRTQWLKAGNGADILSDVYNANPTAMGLVLDTFGKLETPGRKLAVLADMLELGPDAPAMHGQMAAHINDQYSVIFLYGEQMNALLNTLAQKEADLTVYHFNKLDKEILIKTIESELRPDDSILLKGSNGMGLAEVVERLQKMS